MPESSNLTFVLGEVTFGEGAKRAKRVKLLNWLIENSNMTHMPTPSQLEDFLANLDAEEIFFGSLKGGLPGLPCEFADVGNSCIVATGIYTGSASAISLTRTKNRLAKLFYTFSVLFSSAAVASGSSAVIARHCQISRTAAISEAFGASFLVLGKKANEMGTKMSGNTYHPKGLSFVGTYPIRPAGQGSKILVGIGLVVTIYGYGKIIIKLYRFAQQVIHQRKELKKIERQKNQSKLILEQATFIVNFFSNSKYVKNLYVIKKIT